MSGGEPAWRAWMAKAEEHLGAARVLIGQPLPQSSVACFHAQQAVERALETLLLSKGTPPPRTHDLGTLLDYCRTLTPGLEDFREEATRLSAYGWPQRYPHDGAEPSKSDADWALDSAERIVADIRAMLT